MPYPSLPLECSLEILSHVSSPATFNALAQASRQFRNLVTPMLYCNISLFTESAVRQYCKSIEKDSKLALLVKSFSIASSATPQNVSSDHHGFLLGIHHVLKCMSSLTDLSICLVEKPPYQQRHWIFEGTTFQLRRLELRMGYDSSLIDFLTHQPSIESLTLLGAIPDHLTSMRLHLPPNALPNLTHFHGHYTQVLAVVPHRPVRSVHITQVDDTGEFEDSDVFVCLKGAVETMAQSIGPLESITFDDEDTDYGLLEVLLLNLPYLKAITLFVSPHGYSWLRYATPQWFNLIRDRVPGQLAKLQSLNITRDRYGLPWFQPQVKALGFSPNLVPRTTFHAALYTPASPLSFGYYNPSPGRAVIEDRCRHGTPVEMD
ncbi:hypothetical protein ACGC1H_007624 [Rhizoctonia solani]|uniref:F-box domain-containing protein n=1 Tax=Rhizoctonia solani TaxID=456999 RepID=A0A8H3H0C2_9AGAM|nr:unnamed protein product [Rhizoctonia solani]